ncbi:MAG: HAMP domain-containing protein [Treponema sp.]|jgi:adenylate cyclase|nr:HAMP domain-containing protein [Treponema sp.]
MRRQSQSQIRFSIGFKLSLIISFVLVLSLSVITVLVSLLVSADVRLTAENYNWTINRWAANGAETVLSGVRARALLLIRNIDSLGWSPSADPEVTGAAENLIDRFYRLNPDISCAAFAGPEQGGIFINDRFGAEDTMFNPARVSGWFLSRREDLQKAGRGETVLLNGCPFFGTPLLVMLFPLPPEEGFSFSGTGAVFFSAPALESIVLPPAKTGAAGPDQNNISFIVNGSAVVLAHEDPELLRSGAVVDTPIVRQALETGAENLQTLYTGKDGLEYFGAFQRLPGLDAIVVTAVESAQVYRGIAGAVRRVIAVGLAALVLSVIFMIRCSRAVISRPLKALTLAAAAVEAGNYHLDLELKSHDEIGSLTESFIAMSHGLLNFERFTNKELVALARKGLLGRTGETRTVTVCFAMIRDFTGIAEGISPKALVDFVNRFLLRIVPCITGTGGLVDKFLTQSGLVVMAVWGLFPQGKDDPARYAFDCVRSALLMRDALRNLNRRRLVRGKPLIKIGCGINSGEVIAGQMGSEERMEYTIIGDVVNLASRIEEPNDAFDTDILITENTQNLVEERLITEEMPGLKVKGKNEALRVFSVINIKNRYGPVTMEEVRLAWRM